MVIKEVTTLKEIKTFVHFQKTLYKDCPYFVPPLVKGEINTITKHPALAFCDAKFWLAYRDGEVVGRIGGVVNRKCNELKEQKRVRFGWFDTIDDLEVASALLNTVEEWGKAQGMTEICGPSRFSNMEKQAMLIEGFDVTPLVCCDYNYPYYPQLIEQLGFEKEVDYIQYKVPIGEEVPEKINRMANLISKKYNIHLRHFKNRSEMKKLGQEFFSALNLSYANIFNFIPLTKEEIDWTVDEDFQVADARLSSILEDENHKVVGFAFCLPSLSEALKKANGSLFPFGWFHVLRALKKNVSLDLYLTGVLPEYHSSGINVLYHKQIHEISLARGYKFAYTSQQLETNTAALIWPKYGGELIAKRRCYRKDIGKKQSQQLK